ncbi:MAG: hypothetical protein ACFFCS_14365 [Candidatus Hodarchaeota archaeon]
MKRCDIRAAFKEISEMLTLASDNQDSIKQDPSYYLLLAARIETRVKSTIKQELCGKGGENCLRNASRESIVENVASLAREAILKYMGGMHEENFHYIAMKYGELAANEQLKGWCDDCDLAVK